MRGRRLILVLLLAGCTPAAVTAARETARATLAAHQVDVQRYDLWQTAHEMRIAQQTPPGGAEAALGAFQARRTQGADPAITSAVKCLEDVATVLLGKAGSLEAQTAAAKGDGCQRAAAAALQAFETAETARLGSAR